jgi:hypothetical protein
VGAFKGQKATKVARRIIVQANDIVKRLKKVEEVAKVPTILESSCGL